ncbi:MAG: transketolase [Bacteroidetes bacterium 4572_128]|nr:MAG: transketolase [Bacteroidetes bacterium 4572_128]
MSEITKLEKIATQIRRDVLRMVNAQNSGHSGGSLGCADLMTALYFNILDIDAKNFNFKSKDQDAFFLSIGHISPVWYSALARSGHFEIKELKSFRKIGGILQGHPSNKNLNGVRIASGSLGQGLSVANGVGIAKKMDGDKNLVYALMGDGELQEGQIWEAAMFANAHKIDNLIAIIDNNHKQIDGDTDDVIPLLSIKNKFSSFGWKVLEMDGNNMKDLISVLNEAKKETGNQKPVVIIMITKMGKGVDFMEDDHRWHGKAPNNKELKIALDNLEETLGDF